MMSHLTEEPIGFTVEVEHGRMLGCAQWGEVEGFPVLFFHGCPSSRLLAGGLEFVARTAGVRLIAIDRPGIGLSDAQPGRTVLDWPDDVERLADALGLASFAVAAVSAGAPYALACGVTIPARLVAIGVVAGIAPPQFYEHDQLVDLARDDLPAAYELAQQHVANMAADIEASVSALAQRPGPDAAVYADPEIHRRLVRARREATRQGIEGCVEDLILGNVPWGFTLDRVGAKVQWWHGELDPITPIGKVELALREVPSATLYRLPDQGHAVSFVNCEEIVMALTTSSR